MKGLLLQVYRSPGVATAGGISDSCDFLVLVGTKKPSEPIEGLDLYWRASEVTPEAPAVVLVDQPGYTPVLMPLEYFDWRNNATESVVPEGMVGPTRGGAYAGATDENGMIDGRWTSLGVGDLVAIYDRVEAEESYWARKADHQEKVAQSQREELEFQEAVAKLTPPE